MPLSNRFNLENYILIDSFNAESDHTIKIEINKEVFFEGKFIKNKEHRIKKIAYIDYAQPGINTIEIKWNGDKECANKFMKIQKIIVNDQRIHPWSARIKPVSNDYIKNLLSTKEGSIFYRKKIANPGCEQGWYGTYTYKFLIDKHRIRNSKQISLIASTGIKLDDIYTDPMRSVVRKANKK